MKWAVVVFPGSNCDDDAVAGIRRLGDGVHVDKVWHQQRDLSEYDAIVLPGGFSYGDYLRCGALAKFSPVMTGVQEAAERGALVLGICNGFQVLTESGLLPGVLLRNNHLQYRCEMTKLVVQNNDTPFTNTYAKGQQIAFPIAHGEGRYFAEETDLRALQDEHRVVFTYVANPNGSVRDIAGIMNTRGNVLGMMPHPERAVVDWMGSEDGLNMFVSMYRYVKEAVHVG